MKFIDEVTINVQAGKGGDGCCSFRREKFIPFGGPDGGDGGKGGDVYFKATSRLNTLVDLNYQRLYKAQKGKAGSGNLRSGKSGTDLIIEVPIGTLVWENDSHEMIGDLTANEELLLVAKGGKGGLGNHNFKSSINRAPRRIIKGSLGEERNLRLELRLLADVGLLGFPNAGKSTLISKVSAAKPKIADYPFTTIEPHLGVVKVHQHSFVMADIPGILAGAATGVGLGIRFLKHLARNRLLLHVVDLAASFTAINQDHSSNFSHKDQGDFAINVVDLMHDLIKQITVIDHEISSYNDISLNNITRWIIINKVDLLTLDQLNLLKNEFHKLIMQTDPKFFAIEDPQFNFARFKNFKIFWISAISGFGLENLCKEIINYLTSINNDIQ